MVPSARARLAFILTVALATTGGVLALPPIPQDPAYHGFADVRTWLGVPNFWNVVSNAGFVTVGLGGILWLARHARPSGGGPFSTWWEVGAAVVFAGGVFFTGLGSVAYHLAPNHERLVWDRLPMTLVFMSLLALVIGDRIHPAAGRWLLVPLVVTGLASVIVWHQTEVAGRGDLRLYALVQFLPLVLVPLLLVLMPARFTGAGWLWAALGLNAVGKITELADAPVLAMSGVASGHTMKHLLMAGATGLVLVMLAVRRPR